MIYLEPLNGNKTQLQLRSNFSNTPRNEQLLHLYTRTFRAHHHKAAHQRTILIQTISSISQTKFQWFDQRFSK